MAPPASELKAMTDAFDGIDRLAEGAPRTDGAPNFRRLPGFPLFGTGQTSVEGFEKCLEPVLKKYGDEKHIFWVNLRQEPVVYVNGKPYTARDPAKVNFHLEINNPEETSKLETEFAEEVKKRGEDFKYYKDQFGEHPEERANNEEISEKLSGVTTLNEIYAAIKDKVPKLEPIRIPMNQEQAPAEENFDQIVAMLKDTTASCPVIFNCQAGISRTTTAIVCAALVKELQLTRELDRMRGIVPDDILDALKKKKLGLPGIDFEVQEDRNAMQMGEFEVIKELLEAYPAATRHRRREHQGVHHRVQDDLRCVRRRLAGLPQGQDYEQHREVLLPDRVRHVHPRGRTQGLPPELPAVHGRAPRPPHHDRRGPRQARVGAQDPRREAGGAEDAAGRRELQGQHAQDHQAHLRAVLGHVRRPAPRPPQEQLHAQAGQQDHDRDPPRQPRRLHREEVRILGGNPRLLRCDRASELVRGILSCSHRYLSLPHTSQRSVTIAHYEDEDFIHS